MEEYRITYTKLQNDNNRYRVILYLFEKPVFECYYTSVQVESKYPTIKERVIKDFEVITAITTNKLPSKNKAMYEVNSIRICKK